MPRVLLVAYGNPLRSDDGVAWHAADLLSHKFPESEVEILCLHQLGPELAETVRHFELVLFLDASRLDDAENIRPGDVRATEISAKSGGTGERAHFSHVYSPPMILDLASKLYRSSPKSFVVTVAGESFDHGDCLSPSVTVALPKFVERVDQLVREFLSTP